MIRSLVIAALVSLGVGGPAHAAGPTPDGKKVTACMDAADTAGKSSASCIGMILAACNTKPDADDPACTAKELAFWQGQLDTSLKDALASEAAYPEIVQDQKDAQKAWLVFRTKACAIADKVDPGTMPGGSAYCRAEVTAQRVFMLRRIAASLGEH